jgi:hypothetical protein
MVRVGLGSVSGAIDDNAEVRVQRTPSPSQLGGKKAATLAEAKTREFSGVEVRQHGPASSRLKRRDQLCNRTGTGRPVNEVRGRGQPRRESMIHGTMALVNPTQLAGNGPQVAERLEWLAPSSAAIGSFPEQYSAAARTGERE